jgi:adenine-specific DNA-methyltransferase
VTLVTERAGVFDDALQETMLTTYRVGRKSRRGKVNFLTLDGGARAAITKAGVFSLPADPNAPWLLPRAPEHAGLATRLRAMKFRLEPAQAAVIARPVHAEWVGRPMTWSVAN